MNNQGRTIRLFLVDGSPLGLITAEIINWTGKVLSFPRGLLPEALKRPEIAKTGIYLLVGTDPENPFNPLVYIGESDDVAKRLKQHDADEHKDFFEQVALIVSKDENLTKSHVRYLEYRLIEIIRKIGAATLINGNLGSPVLLPEAERSDMEYVVQQLKVLMPVIGHRFLQEVPSKKASQNRLEERTNPETITTFELNAENGLLSAEAYELEGQFIVAAGSRVRYEESAGDSKSGYNFTKEKQLLIKEGKLTFISESYYQLEIEQAFKSPSAASCFVRNRKNFNGRADWKVKGTGQTYGDWRINQVESISVAE